MGFNGISPRKMVIYWDLMGFHPLVIVNKKLWKITISRGKSTISTGPFSIAM